MADRPIIFSAPMVRALLDGRKTQTRRVLKLAGRRPDYIGPAGCQNDPTCWGWEMPDLGGFVTIEGDDKDHLPGWRNGWRDWIGAYAPGDLLWVREAFSYETLDVDRNGFMSPWYWADGNPSSGDFTRPKPPIHMPRWASRLTLTVTDVRVQRLCGVTPADAIAEGIAPQANSMTIDCETPNPRDSFRDLWNSIHGPDAWAANPWVAALTFTVDRRNIDAEVK